MFKKCNTCGEVFPLTIEYFNITKSCKDGFRNKCRKCYAEYTKNYRNINKEKLIKSKKEYYNNNKSKIKEYYQKNKIEKANYRKANKYKLIKYSKQYREANKDKITKAYKTWYEINKDKVLEYGKAYREANKDKLIEIQKRWHISNKDKCNVSHQKYKSMKKQLPNTLTIQQWKQIKFDFNNKCAYCNKELPLAQEHFIALSNGGEYTINNIIPACKSCNSSKGTKDFFEWYPKYKYYSKKREKIILKFLNYHNNAQQLSIL